MGQDIKESFLEMGVNIADDVFCKIVGSSDEMIARCCNFGKVIIVFVPVIKTYLDGGNVDRVFLHENRHAIESGLSIGVSFEDCLTILNEVRTERHAIEDDKQLPTIFSKKKTANMDYYYEKVFPCCEEFLNQYGAFLDRCAIENNYNLLFDAFGKDDICEYGRMLTKTYEEIKDFYINGSGYFELNIERILNLEDRIKKNAIDNDYFPYQKVKK